ncbi:hypothetical protein ABIE26_003648 [Pedobacter africanus]|uniref:Uncharacterized protein n=1 Tax=Pedobacter africanus TaxID=151894 RepID=A0ACC6L0K2_9SPHI|nr:lipocalin family protein [Pedobacter africanus]MDR6784950.1 hypothetical protein [Pedobacter africanus]
MKKLALILLTMLCGFFTNAQEKEQNFDVVSYTLPNGWEQQLKEGGLQLSISDKKSGAYAVAVIIKTSASTASANENFNNHWDNLVKGTVQLNSSPKMSSPINENGWDIISGGANYTDAGHTGLVTLLTATGAGQTVSIILMTNTKNYQNDLTTFLNSLKLTKPSQNANNKASSVATNKSKLAGTTWQAYSLEKFPSSYNATGGFYSGGFWFLQYKFNADGTYQFVYNGASAFAVNPVNVLQYETGTYSISGNQLTITPLKGSNEEWSVGKINNGMSDSHIREVLESRLKRLKTQTRKLEKITYPFKIEYWEGNKEYALMLHHIQNTVRDGSPGANNYSSFFEAQPGKRSHLLPK